MAVISTTWYTGVYSANAGYTISFADNTSGRWAIPNSRTITYGNVTVYWFTEDVNSYSYISSTFVSNTNGRSTIGAGEHMYVLGQDFNGRYRTIESTGTMNVTSYSVLSGRRIISAKGVNGTLVTPTAGANTTVVVLTRPDQDITGGDGVVSVVAGDGVANTGTLTGRGMTAGVWKNWTWNKDVLSSSQQTAPGVATDKSLVLSLLAGYGDDTLMANFESVANPADTWKPGKGNGTMVVHILDDNLNEIKNSNTTADTWSTFKATYLSNLTATAGGKTANWFNIIPDSAYLLNVNSATFTAAPKSPYSIYKWRLERPGGTDEESYGQNTASFSSFAAGNVLHLYLTTASSNPRIRYDGFDTGGDVPANTTVIDPTTAVFAAGKVWSSPTSASFTLQLSPSAWVGSTLGLTKYVIINGGAPVELPASAKSWTITSSGDPYSVTTVKFKQVQAATNGVLTLDIVKDTNTDDVSVSVTASQQGTQLGAPLTADGTVGYYVGEGNVTVVAVPTYANGAVPSEYSITLSVSDATELDSVSGLSATLDSLDNARSIVVTVTRITQLTALTGVALNVTRDTSNGTQVAESTSGTLQAAQGSLVVTFTPGASTLPIHVSCDVGAGYSLRRIIVTDGEASPYTFATVGAKTEIDITLTVPFSKNNSNVRVILVVMANLVPTPVVTYANVYDQGKFTATVTGAYGDFRTGDLVTVDVVPVSVSGSYMTGLLVGRIAFNGVDVAATRDAEKLTVQVPLSVSANVFTVAMYAVLETAYTVGVSPAPTIAVTWKTSDTITISAVTYYRLGIAFTISAEKTRGTSPVYTGVSATSALKAITDYPTLFPYQVDSVLPFEASTAAPTVCTALFTLKGAQKVTLNYATGSANPDVALAVYSYQSSAYITQGVRPVVTITPATGVTLSENLASTWAAPVTNPGTAYVDAVFMVRKVTTDGLLLPVVTISASSGGGRLEVWDGTNWLPRDTRTVTLADACTFTRWAIGTPPSGLVNLTIVDPEIEGKGAKSMPAAVKIYVASAADNIDKSVYAPSVVQVSKNAAVGLSVTTPAGFVFIHWLIGTAIVKGISASVIAGADVTVTPVFAVATTSGSVPMVLGGSDTEYDEGIWISKQFRAQFPWKPLVATVVKERYTDNAQLAVALGTDTDLPNGMFEEAPATTQITVVDGAMRRLPPADMQKSRFVRYGLKLLGGDTVFSVAISTGARTLKGGH